MGVVVECRVMRPEELEAALGSKELDCAPIEFFKEGAAAPYVRKQRREDGTYIVAVAEGSVIGVVELWKSLFAEDEVCMNFISVSPEFKGKGVASALVDKVAQTLDARTLLSRSIPSPQGKARIQQVIDRKLDAAGIPWIQAGREQVGRTVPGTKWDPSSLREAA